MPDLLHPACILRVNFVHVLIEPSHAIDEPDFEDGCGGEGPECVCEFIENHSDGEDHQEDAG